jgi:hypothetical protein
MAVLCSIASADGPINSKEAGAINVLLGIQSNETSYNEFLKSRDTTYIPELFRGLIHLAILSRAHEAANKRSQYDPANDPIVKSFEVLGQVVASADGDVNQGEIAVLSKLIAIARSDATGISRTIHSLTIPKTGPVPQYEPAATNQNSIAKAQSPARVSGDGGYLFEVSGESHYQSDLERIVGGRTESSANYQCIALLTPEPDNPYDPHAVGVSINGHKVGHLSRDWAAKFGATLASSGYAQATCNALIVGGWDRGGDRGNFGVKLDVALPLDLNPASAET